MPRRWLYGIAANLLRDHHRAERRRLLAYAKTGVDPILDGGFDAVGARLDAGAEGPAVARALARLTPGDRETLLLYAWADLTYREIAEALTIPIGTVRSRCIACASPGPRDPRGERFPPPPLSERRPMKTKVRREHRWTTSIW